jgi:hypothetical protein
MKATDKLTNEPAIICQWCQELNSPRCNYCKMCGHELGKPPEQCNCTRCKWREMRRRASLN